MKYLYIGVLLLFCVQFYLQAQKKETPKTDIPIHSAHKRKIPIDTRFAEGLVKELED